MMSLLGAWQLLVVAICLIAEPIESLRTGTAKLSTSANATLHLASRHKKAGTVTVTLHRATRPRHLHSRSAKSLVQTSSEEDPCATVNQHVNPQAIEVFGTIYVGTPPQQFSVAFDTGSGNMILPARSCKSMACLQKRPYDAWQSASSENIMDMNQAEPSAPGAARETVSMTIGHGEVTGDLITDKVCLDQEDRICVKSSFIETTKMSDEPFSLFPFDGILGLGMPSGSLDKRFNLLGNLAEDGTLKHNQFAVWLTTPGDEPEQSEITFGSYDDRRLGSAITWVPVSNTNTGMWQVKMEDIYVDGVRLGLCDPNSGCQVAMDTGTSVISGPSEHIKAILAQLNIKQDCSNYEAQLNKTVGFGFGDMIMNIDISDYVTRTVSGCFHQFLGLDMAPPKGPLMLLGDPFLKRYYTIYDRENLNVGVGFAQHKKGPRQGETIEQTAARLLTPVNKGAASAEEENTAEETE